MPRGPSLRRRRQHADALASEDLEEQLHQGGALAEVSCLACRLRVDRDALQARLLADNPRALEWQHTLLPDGDAELPDEALAHFVIPACEACGGIMKPDVVFFGDSVPRPRVDAAFACLDAAQALLVAGSSLAVFSGYRFVLRAKERGLAVAVLNLGPTRADPDATVRLEADVSSALPRLVASLMG